MSQKDTSTSRPVFDVVNPQGTSPMVLVCEHASCFIPAHLSDLGLSPEARRSHAAWDPGALGVAQDLSQHLDAVLVASRISRLVYDANRPPGHPGAMPEQSEVYDVPGNVGLSEKAKSHRYDNYYLPFHNAVAGAMSGPAAPILITVHSFTPVYHGVAREVEIGILHDADRRLADAMLTRSGDHTSHVVRRNEPYGPVDGVTHTVAAHATPRGLPNVMLEIRNDLIQTTQAQARIARQLAGWLSAAVADLQGDAS